jgi:hypothetical protein
MAMPMRAASASPCAPGVTVGRMEPYNTALDADCPCINQGSGHLPPGLLDDSAERGPGNVHSAGRFLMAETLQVRQPYRLQLIHGQYRYIRWLNGHLPGYEAHTGWIKANPTGFNGSSHSIHSPAEHGFKHMLIINVVTIVGNVKAFQIMCFGQWRFG